MRSRPQACRSWNPEGAITFRCATPAAALQHLLRSGAGTAYHDALDPARRPALEQRFLKELGARHAGEPDIPMVHEYVACIALKPL